MHYRITALAALTAMTLHLNAQSLATPHKAVTEGNPISSCVFCADPTALVYQDRLYVYVTPKQKYSFRICHTFHLFLAVSAKHHHVIK